jgi:hypothetical protein
MIRATILAAALVGLGAVVPANAADWLSAPSTYTHDPQTGERVSQYAPVAPVFVQTRPDYLKSGYRHNRSSIYSGDGADNQHIVEQWGRPVRPYGEWLYPYRPYSVPYQLWGPPYAGLGYPYRPHPHWHQQNLGPPPGNAPAAPAQNHHWRDEGQDQPPVNESDWGAASGST